MRRVMHFSGVLETKGTQRSSLIMLTIVLLSPASSDSTVSQVVGCLGRLLRAHLTDHDRNLSR